MDPFFTGRSPPINVSRRGIRNRTWAGSISLFLSLSLFPLNAEAATITWTGAFDGNWFGAGNWSPAQVPSSIDDVVIDLTATVSASGGTSIAFAALTLGDAAGNFAPTLRLSAAQSTSGSVTIHRGAKLQQDTNHQIVFGALNVLPGGMLTHTANSSMRSFLVNLSVAGDFDLQAGASIAVSGLGYAGGSGFQVPGSGPGGGGTSANGEGAGGGHGGKGGQGSGGAPGGLNYDSATDPTDLGSGGGGAHSNAGGAGGGAVLIAVGGAFSVNGAIMAGGDNGRFAGSSHSSGGGAGGTVNITASSFNGAGQILANGGTGANNSFTRGGGGGGGRISIVVTGSDTSNLNLQANSGNGGGAGTTGGGAGVIAVKTPGGTDYNLSIGDLTAVPQSGTGVAGSSPTFSTVTVYNSIVTFDAGSNVAINSLVVAGGAQITGNNFFFGSVSPLVVRSGGALQITANSLTFPAGSPIEVQAGGSLGFAVAANSGGILNVRNGGTFRQLNTQTLNFDSVSVEPGGVVTHAANTSVRSALLNLNVAGNFDLQAGASIAVSGLGYAGGSGFQVPGSGPGGGGTSANGEGAGGGHGGKGGQGSGGALGGLSYDSATNPTDLGSGGGGAHSNAGGGGGGAVLIAVGGAFSVNGTISADGGNGRFAGSSHGSGGGAGGTVNITAAAFNGSGQVMANGGTGATNSFTRGGGGGGGRISIVVTGNDTSNLNLQANSGNGGGTGTTGGGAGVIALKTPGGITYNLSIGDLTAVPQSGTGVAGSSPTFSTVTVNNSIVTFDAGSDVSINSLVVAGGAQITGSNFFFGAAVPLMVRPGGSLQLTANMLTFPTGSPIEVQGGGTLAFSIGSNSGGSLIVRGGGTFRQLNTQPVSFDSISVEPGGILTHAANNSARSALLNLSVAGNFDLQAGASIAVSGLGYAGGAGLQVPGSGPGGGGSSVNGDGAGGGHGGAGGQGSGGALGGLSYDSATNPTDLGSGGGGTYGTPGGSGGGAVLIVVGGAFSLNGTINAGGGNGALNGSGYYSSGGGAGGTVNVTAATFGGSGRVLADGGAGFSGVNTRGGGGGGGIVALSGCRNDLVSSDVKSGASGGPGAAAGAVGSVNRTASPSCPNPPPVPVDLRIASTIETPSGGATTTVVWSPQSTATSYTLQISTDPSFAIAGISVTTPVASAAVADLTLGTTYHLRVRATNDFGDSAYSATLTAFVILTIVDNSDYLIVPAGSTYTLAGSRSYANSVVVGGTLLVAPLNAVTSGFLELSAPLVRVNVGGVLSADGVGYRALQGPGAGYSTSPGQFDDQGGGGGGAYGGMGGVGGYAGAPARDHSSSGAVYGAIDQPADLGSGGGNTHSLLGGTGGGRLSITAGTLQLDGRISANGQNGAAAPPSYASGGGSGGTVVLSLSNFHGTGIVAANGGSSLPQDRFGGGGGGGRIVVAYVSSDFTGAVTAHGGSGGQQGGAGTVVYGGELRIENAARGADTILSGAYAFVSIRVATNAVVELTSAAAVTATTLIVEGPSLLNVDNGALDVQQISVRSGANLRYAGGSLAAADLAVSSGAVVTLNTSLSLSQMTVNAGGQVTHESGSTGFALSVSGNLTVEAGGVISADGAGFAAGQGPGAGEAGGGNQFNNNGGGGGGYGGFGGVARVPLGGPSYGSMMQPLELGSGGGTAHGAGGRGGGRLKIAAGTLRVDGRISANGRDGESSAPEATFKIPSGGGGSGGSVLISASNLQGAGMIAADGGIAPTLYGAGGGGSGGRMAVTYGSTAFTGSLSARGGTGSQAGGAGTIVYGSELRVGSSVQGAITPIPSGTYSFATIRASTGAVVELTSNATVNGSNLFVEGPSLLRLHTGVLNVSRIELLPLAEFRYDGGTLTVTDVVVGSSAILTVDTRLKATQLTVRSGGLVTHAAKNAAFELAITNTLTVEAGALISADGMGFPADQGVGHGYLGFGSLNGSRGGGGGGYGGLGGVGNNSLSPFSGAIYGSLMDPQELGSGGGTVGGAGGAGGGRLKISAGTLRVDGRITADGRDGNREPPDIIISISGGGGSGGAVSIVASDIQGSGSISANGGLAPVAGNRGGGGGGGRIALFYGSRSGAWSVAANGGAGFSSGRPGTIIDNGQVSGLDMAASSGTLAASQLAQKLDSSRTLTETLSAQVLDFTGATATGTAPGTFSAADMHLVTIKTGSFAEKGFFRGNWTLAVSAITSFTGEWEGMAFLAADEPRRVIVKGVLKGQIRGTLDGVLTETSLGSGVFNRLAANIRVVQVDAAVGAGGMFIQGTGTLRDSAQYPGTSLSAVQTSLTGQIAGYYSNPIDLTFTLLRVNAPSNPYQSEGFFYTTYVSTQGPGVGWAYASGNGVGARLDGIMTDPFRGLMEGAVTLGSPRSVVLTLQNLDVGLPFQPSLIVDISGPDYIFYGSTLTYSITLRNTGYSGADGVSVIAEYPDWMDFVSATGNYIRYDTSDRRGTSFVPRPYLRWDFVQVPARSSITLVYQSHMRFLGPGAPALNEDIGGSVQLITKAWADKVFANFPDGGTP